MTEISTITQNGTTYNLKDATGRTLLDAKQDKLTAGNGIKIDENNVISRTDVTPTLDFVDVTDKFPLTLTGYYWRLDGMPAYKAEASGNLNLVLDYLPATFCVAYDIYGDSALTDYDIRYDSGRYSAESTSTYYGTGDYDYFVTPNFEKSDEWAGCDSLVLKFTYQLQKTYWPVNGTTGTEEASATQEELEAASTVVTRTFFIAKKNYTK